MPNSPRTVLKRGNSSSSNSNNSGKQNVYVTEWLNENTLTPYHRFSLNSPNINKTISKTSKKLKFGTVYRIQEPLAHNKNSNLRNQKTIRPFSYNQTNNIKSQTIYRVRFGMGGSKSEYVTYLKTKAAALDFDKAMMKNNKYMGPTMGFIQKIYLNKTHANQVNIEKNNNNKIYVKPPFMYM